VSDEYAKLTGVNWSSLRHMATSPLLYKWRLTHPKEPTDEMIMGQAIHTAILEPEEFSKRFAVFDGTRRGKVWDAWEEDHPGVESLKPKDLANIDAVVNAVLSHPVAAAMLEGGAFESPITWTDPDTGFACKARGDCFRPNRVVDLKSTSDASPRAWSKKTADMLHHGQFAFYHFGAIAAGRMPPDALSPVAIVVEQSEPYDVAVYAISDAALFAGRALGIELMNLLGACADADYWPGVAPELLTLDLPKWARGVDSTAEVTV